MAISTFPPLFKLFGSGDPAKGIEFLGRFHLFNNPPFTILLQRMPRFEGGRSFRTPGNLPVTCEGEPT
jgi:hypothetical protein